MNNDPHKTPFVVFKRSKTSGQFHTSSGVTFDTREGADSYAKKNAAKFPKFDFIVANFLNVFSAETNVVETAVESNQLELFD